MMALPFLRADVIADEFQTLHTAADDPRVAQHLQYMELHHLAAYYLDSLPSAGVDQ